MYTATSSSDAINLFSPPPEKMKEENEKIMTKKEENYVIETLNVVKLNLRSISSFSEVSFLIPLFRSLIVGVS